MGNKSLQSLRPLKLPKLGIEEVKYLQEQSEKLLADPKNLVVFDEIFPIFANDTMVFSVAILDFINNWEKSKNKKKRREEIIELIHKVRKLNWIVGDVRGYHLG